MIKLRQPTTEECEANAPVDVGDAFTRFATFHPQWGGYGARCIVTIDSSGCFDVTNWHDGEFPIGEDDPAKPDEKHYCNAMQLVEFGLKVLEAQAEKFGSIVNDADRVKNAALRLNALAVKAWRP